MLRLVAFVPTTVVLAMLARTGRADPITLEQAVARAARRPAVGMAGADVDAAQADARGAARPIYNPEIGVAAGPRRVNGTTGVEIDVSVAQTIELGGKRAARAAAGEARARATSATLAVEVREAELDARRAFQLSLVARSRLEAAREGEALATQIDAAMRDQQALGAGTQLRVNLVAAELGRVRHDRIDAENQYESALATLATAVGAEPQERLEPVGEIALSPAVTWTEQEVVKRALARRPELTRQAAERDAAAADVRLADALGRPDLTVGLSYGFEQDVDAEAHTVLGSVSIALPIRNRNQGGRAAARARLRRAQLDEQRQRVDVEREARLALGNYQRAREAVLGFDREVVERLHENLELAQQSFTSGKIDYFEFNVVRRELLASRAAYLDAVAEEVDAWHTLVRAAAEEQKP